MASVAATEEPIGQRNKTDGTSENPDLCMRLKSQRAMGLKSQLKAIQDEMKKQTEIVEAELSAMEQEYNDLSNASRQRELGLNTKLTELQARLVQSMEETMTKQTELNKLQERYETLFASHAKCASNAKTLDFRVSLLSRQKASAERDLENAKSEHFSFENFIIAKYQGEKEDLQRKLKQEKGRVLELEKSEEARTRKIDAIEALLYNYLNQPKHPVLQSGEASRSQQTSVSTTPMESRRFRTKQTARKTTGGQPPQKQLAGREPSRTQSTMKMKSSGQTTKKRRLGA
ncbi:hypothetical protein CPB83DRAFT_844525 [Crepidotus variabilis]|uniref:Uncharacterized protein n=1 Tax=Crepidotus variabilis TaxID=179855 RepID=A0A9P6JU36_9AGAR|nr:hypothetical protein CPB83DRAFT_844525 [Crepidotus variabilis]